MIPNRELRISLVVCVVLALMSTSSQASLVLWGLNSQEPVQAIELAYRENLAKIDRWEIETIDARSRETQGAAKACGASACSSALWDAFRNWRLTFEATVDLEREVQGTKYALARKGALKRLADEKRQRMEELEETLAEQARKREKLEQLEDARRMSRIRDHAIEGSGLLEDIEDGLAADAKDTSAAPVRVSDRFSPTRRSVRTKRWRDPMRHRSASEPRNLNAIVGMLDPEAALNAATAEEWRKLRSDLLELLKEKPEDQQLLQALRLAESHSEMELIRLEKGDRDEK